MTKTVKLEAGLYVARDMQAGECVAIDHADDATKALKDLLWAVQKLRHGPNSEYAVHARYVDLYLGKFAATEAGAALIRQEEGSGST
jgi:hypothetical protein